jgi:hypothetical protein
MKWHLPAILIAGLAAGSLAMGQDKQKSKKDGGKMGKSVNVSMHAQNKSGESGRARLTAEGSDKTKVEITLKGAPKGTPQPAHIHEGSCAKLDPKPKQGLENVVDGKSTTVVPMSIDQLTGGNLAINVHKSGEDIKTYVSCGDIRKAGAKSDKKGSSKKS